jgi:hypothetical protein
VLECRAVQCVYSSAGQCYAVCVLECRAMQYTVQCAGQYYVVCRAVQCVCSSAGQCGTHGSAMQCVCSSAGQCRTQCSVQAVLCSVCRHSHSILYFAVLFSPPYFPVSPSPIPFPQFPLFDLFDCCYVLCVVHRNLLCSIALMWNNTALSK